MKLIPYLFIIPLFFAPRFSYGETTTTEISSLIHIAEKFSETNPDSALFYSNIALRKATQLQNNNLIADCYYELGSAYLKKEIDDSASYYLLNALNLYKEINDSDHYISTLLRLSEYYRSKSELDKAESFARKALSFSSKNNSSNHLALAYNRLGAIVFEQSINNSQKDSLYKDYLVRAILYADSSSFWAEKNNEKKFQSSNDNILGACYTNLKEYDRANHYLRSALNHADLFDKPIIYMNIGTNYLKMKDYQNAADMALAGLRIADSIKLSSGLWHNYYLLYLIEDERKNERMSLFYLKKADSLQTVVYNENISTKTKQFEAKYKNKENELLIEQKNSELINKDRAVSYLWTGFLFVILILAMVLYFILRIRKTNRLLRAKNSEIESANKELAKLIQFKEDFTGMIVHDLKNPLNTIINYSRTDSSESAGLKDGGKIEIAALSMLSIVNNLIDLQKFEEAKVSLRPSFNSLNNIINTAMQNVTLLLSQKNIIVSNTINQPVYLNCDKELIERVMINLLTNAIKFSPINKTITIEGEVMSEFTRIKITDEGQGISKDKIPSLFKKHGRAEIRNIGLSISSGLGLAFSKLVINAHDGEIGVDSEVGKGSTFWFTLKTEINTEKIDEIQKYHLRNDIEYSAEFVDNILLLKKALAGYQFYETGKILTAIKNFECYNSEFGHWKNQIEMAILYSNKIKYLELISII